MMLLHNSDVNEDFNPNYFFFLFCFIVVSLFVHDSNMIRQNLIKKARPLNQNTPTGQRERVYQVKFFLYELFRRVC